MAHEATAVASIKPHNVESQNVDSLVPQQLQGTAANLIGLLKDYYNYMNIDGVPTQLAIIDSDDDASELAYDDLVKSESHLGLEVTGFIPTSYNQKYTQLTPSQLRDSGFNASIVYQGITRPEYYVMKLNKGRAMLSDTWVMATRIADTVDIDFYDANWEEQPYGSTSDNPFRIDFLGNPNGEGYNDSPAPSPTTSDTSAFDTGKAKPIALVAPEAPEQTRIVKFINIPTKGGHGEGLTVDITVDSGKLVEASVNTPGFGYEVDDSLELDLFYNSALISVQETQAGPSRVVRTILEEHDIDKTTDDYLVRIQKEIAKGIPDAKSLDKNTLYKKIVEYYNTRGSKISVQSFFKIFFDEVAKVSYPKDVLLKPSDGIYTGTPTISNTREKYFYKKGNDQDQDSRIEFLHNISHTNERIGTYFIDFEFGDNFKRGVNAPTSMTGNEASVYGNTMLFSARNNRVSTNFASKDYYKDAGVFLKIDANNDLIISGKFGDTNGNIADFSHTISNYVAGTNDFPFRELANNNKQRIKLAISIDVRQELSNESTPTSGSFAVTGASNSAYNATYTLDATTGNWAKDADIFFSKEADGRWAFNYYSNKRIASAPSRFPYTTPTSTWAGTFLATQSWAFNTTGVTEGNERYVLGRVRLTTSNFGTLNNSPHDSDNGTNNDITITTTTLSNTQYVNLYPGVIGRTYLTNSLGGFGLKKYKERDDENPDGELYFYGFSFYNRFCTDAEVKRFVSNGRLPNSLGNKLIDLEFDNGGSVNLTNKAGSKVVAKNVVGFTTGYTPDNYGDIKNASFQETNYGLSSTGSSYPRNISWKNVKGFLSDVNKIHDGHYYQEFSYLVKTTLSQETWKEAFNKLVHPAGLRFFNALILELFRNNPIGKTPADRYLSRSDLSIQGLQYATERRDLRSFLISEGLHFWFPAFKPDVGTHSPKWQYGWFEYLADRYIEIFVYELYQAWYKQEQRNMNNLGNIFYDHDHGLRLRQEKPNTTLQGNAEIANIDSSQEISFDKKYIELDGNGTAIQTGADITKDSVVELTFKCLQDGKDAKGKYIAGTKWTGTDGFERELSIKQIENEGDIKQVEVTVTDNGAAEITSGTLADNNIHSIEVTAETFDRRSGEFGIRFTDTSIDFSDSDLMGSNELNGIFTHHLNSAQASANTRPNLRGHHLFQFDRTTKVIERIYTDGSTSINGNPVNYAHFDTYNSVSQRELLATRINGIADGKVVILVTYDASGCDGTMRQALIGCGAEDERSTWKNARVGHAFIGVKGATSGAIERIETNLGGVDNVPNQDGQPIIRVTGQYTVGDSGTGAHVREGAFYTEERQPQFKPLPVKVPLYKDGFTTIIVKGTGEVDRRDPSIGTSATVSLRSTDETDNKFYNELVYGNEDYRHRLHHTQPTVRVGNKFQEALWQYNFFAQGATPNSDGYKIKISVENFTLKEQYKAKLFIRYFNANNNFSLLKEKTVAIDKNGDFSVEIPKTEFNWVESRAAGTDPVGQMGIEVAGLNTTQALLANFGSFDVTNWDVIKLDINSSGVLNELLLTDRFISATSPYVAQSYFVGNMNTYFANVDGTRGNYIQSETWDTDKLEIEELTLSGYSNDPDGLVTSFRFKPMTSAAETAISNYATTQDASTLADLNHWTRIGRKFSGGLGYSKHGIIKADEKGPGGVFTMGLNRDINLQNKTPIEKHAEYEVSVTLKNLIQQDNGNNRVYIGVQSLDENGVEIKTDLENSYNYGVVQGYKLAPNEEVEFSGKFKGFNPRTIIPEGEETLTEDIDPLKFVFGFGFNGWSVDLSTNTYMFDSTREDFANFGGGAMTRNINAGGSLNNGSYGETANVYELLGDNPISFANPGKIEFTGALAPGNSNPTTVKFKFERNIYPNTDPSFITESVVIDSATEKKYTIEIPAQAASLSYRHMVMFIEEIDQPVILKDITVFDDRLGGQGTILKTNDNRFDPGAKFFNVVILTNHHNSVERANVYTSDYTGPNGAQAIKPHIPSTMIKNIKIRRTDGKAIRDDKVDRQHQMFGIKKIINDNLPLLNHNDGPNNTRVNTLAIGTVNKDKQFIGVHSFNDSPATSTNLLQTTAGFDYPWVLNAGFRSISGFNPFGTTQNARAIESVVEVGTTTKIVLDALHGYKVDNKITIYNAQGLSPLNGTHTVLEIATPQNDLSENEMIINVDISQVTNSYKKFTGTVATSKYQTGLSQFDFERSEINTVYGETPWGNTGVVARTQNLDGTQDLPKIGDDGEIQSLFDERQDGGFYTNLLQLNTGTRQQMGASLYGSPHISDDYRFSVYFKLSAIDAGNWYFGLNAFNASSQEVGLGIPRNTAFGGRRRNIVRVDRISDADATDEQSAGIYVYTEGHNNYSTSSIRTVITLQGSTTFNGGAEYFVGEVKRVTIDGEDLTRIKVFKNSTLTSELTTTDVANAWDLKGTIQTVGARNPYFGSASIPSSKLEADKWYLAVGILFGRGGVDQEIGRPNYKHRKYEDLEDLGGIYEVETGKKVRNATARQLVGDAVKIRMRNFLWRVPEESALTMDIFEPRIDILNGTEPTFEDLLSKRVESTYPSKLQVTDAFIGGSYLGEQDCKYLLTETNQTGNSLAKLTSTSKRYDNNTEIWNTPSSFTGAIVERTLENTLGKAGTFGKVLKAASIADTREFTGNPYTPDFTDSVFGIHSFTNVNGGRDKFRNQSTSDGEFKLLLGKQFTVRSDQWSSTLNSPNGPAGSGANAEFHLKFYSGTGGSSVCASINPVKPGVNFRQGEVIKIDDKAFRDNTPSGAAHNGLYFVIDDVGRGVVTSNGGLANLYADPDATYNSKEDVVCFTRDKQFSNSILQTNTLDFVNDDYYWDLNREYEIEFDATKFYDKNKPANLYIGGGDKIGYYQNLGGLGLSRCTGNPNAIVKLNNHGIGPFEYEFVSSTEGFCRIYIAMYDAESGPQVAHNGHVLKPVNTDARGVQGIDMRKAPFDYKGGSSKLRVQSDANNNTNRDGKLDRQDEMVEFVLESEHLQLGKNVIQIFNNKADGVSGGYIKVEPADQGLVTPGANTHTVCMRGDVVGIPKIILDHKIDRNAHRYTDGENSSSAINNSLVKLNEREDTLYEYNWQLKNVVIREKTKRVYHGDFQCIVDDAVDGNGELYTLYNRPNINTRPGFGTKQYRPVDTTSLLATDGAIGVGGQVSVPALDQYDTPSNVGQTYIADKERTDENGNTVKVPELGVPKGKYGVLKFQVNQDYNIHYVSIGENLPVNTLKSNQAYEMTGKVFIPTTNTKIDQVFVMAGVNPYKRNDEGDIIFNPVNNLPLFQYEVGRCQIYNSPIELRGYDSYSTTPTNINTKGSWVSFTHRFKVPELLESEEGETEMPVVRFVTRLKNENSVLRDRYNSPNPDVNGYGPNSAVGEKFYLKDIVIKEGIYAESAKDKESIPTKYHTSINYKDDVELDLDFSSPTLSDAATIGFDLKHAKDTDNLYELRFNNNSSLGTFPLADLPTYESNKLAPFLPFVEGTINPGGLSTDYPGNLVGFQAGGAATTNDLVKHPTPFGERVVWRMRNVNGNANQSDGEMLTAAVNIDNTKDYRFSVWIKKANTDFNDDTPNIASATDGGFVRFGVSYGTAGTGVYTNVTTPSFSASTATIIEDFDFGKHDTLDSPAAGYNKGLNNNKWFLLVGHIRKFNADVDVVNGSSNLPDSGIYIPSKPAYKIRELETPNPAITAFSDSPHYGDFKFAPTINDAKLFVRVAKNGKTTEDPVYVFAPRIDEINGFEPSITDLTSGAIIEKANGDDLDKKLVLTTWNNPIVDTELTIGDYAHAIQGDDFTVNINNVKYKNDSPEGDEVREIYYADSVNSRFKTINGWEDTEFIVTITEDMEVLGNHKIVLPLVPTGPVNLTVDWGNGTGAAIYSKDDAAMSDALNPGTYRIRVSGDWKKIDSEVTEAGIAANAVGSRTLVTHGLNNFRNGLISARIGKVNVTQLNFKGCVNLASFAVAQGITNTSGLTTLHGAFENCAALKSLDLRGMDTSNVTDFGDFMKQTSAITGVNIKGLHSLNISSATTLADMFDNVTFNSDELGRTYIAWANNTFGTTPSSLTFDAGSTQYPTGSTADSPNDSPAEDLVVAARNTLDTTKSWTITDGGVIS